MRALVLAPALALALVVGCGSFSEGDSPQTPPAGADGGDAGPIEPSDDGGVTPDAGSVDDDGGIPPAQSCDQAILCDDFERSDVADPRWNDVANEGGATLATSDQQFHAGQRSLFVDLPESGSADRRARVERTFQSRARRLTARFWLRVEALPTTGDIIFAQMRTELGQVFLMLQGGKLALSAGTIPTGTDSGKSETSIGIGLWYEIAFDYRSGNSPKATVVVGGTRLDLAVSAGGGDVSAFGLGATFAQAGSAASYSIDDVSLERGF